MTKQASKPPRAPRRQNIPLIIDSKVRKTQWSRSDIAKAIKQFDKITLDSSPQLSRMFDNLSLDSPNSSSTMPDLSITINALTLDPSKPK